MSSATHSTVCRLCGQERQLRRSHIYPKFTFNRMKAREGGFIRFDGRRRQWERRNRQDDCFEYLLCQACESLFQPWESAVARFIRTGILDEIRPLPGRRYNVIHVPDYAAVKLYLMSLLWRCHAARADQFRHVDLGPRHDAKLRELLLAKDPGEPWEYGCSVSVLHLNTEDELIPRPAMGVMPETIRYQDDPGLRMVRLIIDGIILHYFIGSESRMRGWRGNAMFAQKDGRVVIGVGDGMEMPFFRQHLEALLSSEPPSPKMAESASRGRSRRG